MDDLNTDGGAAATQTLDFDSMTPDELDTYIASGGTAAPAEAEPTEPTEPTEPAEEQETPAEEKEESPAEEKEESPAEELDEAAILERVEKFKFTKDASPEVRAKEEAEYLELVEIAEPVKQMIAARDARLAELEQQIEVQTDPVQKLHSEAFDGLVEFVEKEDGSSVPNTEPLRQLLKTHYPAEREQFILDTMLEPSEKYPGYTVYQESLRDIGNLSDPQVKAVSAFIENGGRFDFPSFVPEGIDPNVGEAYWTNPDRKEIDERIERAAFVLRDQMSSEEERQEAEADIEKLNRHLAMVQKGMDADARQQDAERQSKQTVQQQISNAGNQNYIKTTLGLMEQVKEDIAKGLTMFDPDAADLTAEAYGTQILSALSDNDEYAKAAQKKLVSKGIKVDWAGANQALARLYQSERQIAALDMLKANPRAIEIEQRKKSQILLEIKSIQKNLVGQLVAKVTTGAGKALQTKLASAPKNAARPSAVKPRIPGSSPAAIGKKNFDDMSLEELNSHVGRLKAEAGYRY